MKKNITIGAKTVGKGFPVFIIAEAGVNHNGDISLAKKLVDVAKEAGADAVKFQTFDPDTLVTKDAAKADYQNKNEGMANGTESQHSMLKRLMLKREEYRELKAYAEQKGIIFLSTPFSLADAEFLRDLGVSALKIGSSDTDNIPFLRTIASWKLPLILSTGMSDLSLVKESVGVIRAAGNEELIVLHCTTNYPTPPEEVNMRALQTLEKELDVLVGFSDHTEGVMCAVAAVALGAVVVEKHLTLDKGMEGPDHKASLNPEEFGELVRSIRNIELALGTGEKDSFSSEKRIAQIARKSLVTSRPVKKGELFTAENLTTKRPGTGIPPREFDRVLGTKAVRDIPEDTILTIYDYIA
ncbi:MAG: N-acetylneuraminate synthase [Candidatus Taylorbacteria bacterium CG11_big_fil_rev_8_21_14_0_20_46_11]|uniref:N-acetylneuraminate synthase n=1 Tax=Candidatus Taylorbacteria bacterium CG11_big_fil_rev_8_21_14_0_20_46_11 TaxID=1975025 RepID=A0A2H0KCS4_9BACT|nr:MAG: N-acetylneuraminate synthase [Candidatus Taylorbacteria bacterium CG11_big_fil_rev_8_21_14_0_20_46_11]